MHILNMQFRSSGTVLGRWAAFRRCPVAPRNAAARHWQSGFGAMSFQSARRIRYLTAPTCRNVATCWLISATQHRLKKIRMTLRRWLACARAPAPPLALCAIGDVARGVSVLLRRAMSSPGCSTIICKINNVAMHRDIVTWIHMLICNMPMWIVQNLNPPHRARWPIDVAKW